MLRSGVLASKLVSAEASSNVPSTLSINQKHSAKNSEAIVIGNSPFNDHKLVLISADGLGDLVSRSALLMLVDLRGEAFQLLAELGRVGLANFRPQRQPVYETVMDGRPTASSLPGAGVITATIVTGVVEGMVLNYQFKNTNKMR
jgi:hypothetical protein